MWRGEPQSIVARVKPTIDDRDFPILVVSWPAVVDLGDIDAHFDEMLLLARRGRIGVVVDMTASGTPSAAYRKYAARRLAGLYAEVGDRVAAVAHVIASPLVRAMLSSVYWFSPPPFSATTMATVEEARAWVQARLR